MVQSDFQPDKLDKLCNEVLTNLEETELRLLNWGFVDVKNDVETALPEILTQLPTPIGQKLWEEAQQFGVTPTDILDNLTMRKLLFALGGPQPQLYRTRFAETMRLLTLLRQRFSKEDWQTALRLVTDSKINIKRRRYPKRTIEADDIRQTLRQIGATPSYIEAISCLLKKDNGPDELVLAKFQKDAIIQHCQNLFANSSEKSPRDHAVVIGAGTGAGKTKAFYIPALAEIAENITTTRYVQAIAIYPRVELLKDQLSEAFFEARKLDTFLKARKPHVITVGAYYGDTPTSAKLLLDQAKDNQIGWNRVKLENGKEGWVCPYFSCPNTIHQQQNLLWYIEDLKKEIDQNKQKRYGEFERLCCPQCNFAIEGNQIFLTRDRMIRAEVPDILFTTTEMLNKHFSHVNVHNLLGINIKNTPPPRMLLLDEIHTYEGVHGAHIAYLLRRWRHARCLQQATSLYCVGLSATLSDATSFFHKLTGIPQTQVGYIYPNENDMDVEGAEYNVVLKGDPVSTTNLLSTSVQTAMLLARMLDISSTQPSHGTFGQKIFAFTDKLDVTNRWYQIEYDAEVELTLSKFRERGRELIDIQHKKFIAGQDWQFASDIGHRLGKPLRIDITSSQNRGVDAKANLIIATSTLEVGFNDPTVGAVIQHKAPQSMASFLQRKGRAGRSRAMRPWMVVITSAYGRDRWAFQHSENLFDPTLQQIHIPLENYYVRKIQAVFALLDWLTLMLRDEDDCYYLNLWTLLSRHGSNDSQTKQRGLVAQLLEDILTGIRRNTLISYLRQALQLNRKEVESLLWDEPRSLLFEVIPTLLRQLKTDWQKIDANGKIHPHADNLTSYPLPDFITPTLFSELKSSDIPIHIPPDHIKSQVNEMEKSAVINRKEREEILPLLQCLTEFAPGNVSRRYTNKEDHEGSHWIPILKSDDVKKGILTIEDLRKSIVFDDIPQPFRIDQQDFYLYRPRSYALQRVPPNIKNSSSGRLIWKSYFEGKNFQGRAGQTTAKPVAEILRLATRSQWSKIFTEIRSYTLAHDSWIQVARLATEIRAETRYDGPTPPERQWLTLRRDTNTNELAGIGFVNYVDGLQFQFQPLNINNYKSNSFWPERYKTLRPEYFRYELQNHPNILAEKLSFFEVDWLWQLEFSMLVATAVGQQCNLEQAAHIVAKRRIPIADRAMKVIFQSQQAEENGEEKVGRLYDKLKGFLEQENIVQALEETQQTLWVGSNRHIDEWLQQCYASSLGATLFTSLTQLIPDIDPDDLVMDVDGNSIWITEKTPGGVGLISKIIELLKSQPYAFDMQMLDTLHYCEREHLAMQLCMVTDCLEDENIQIQQAFESMRLATQINQQEIALNELKDKLEEQGISASRELVVALQSKFLRPSSDSDTDKLVTQLVKFWQNEEDRLNCAIDLRVIAVAALGNSSIKQTVSQILQRISGETNNEESQIFNILQSLLWLPCTDSCPGCIESSQPYQQLVKPSRTVLLSLLKAEEPDIQYGQTDWFEHTKEQLSITYNARITCQQDQLAECQQYLFQLLVDPIEIGYQLFFPMVEHITRIGRSWTIEMKVQEFAHA